MGLGSPGRFTRDIADALLAGGDGPTVLTTSRVPLGHEHETVFHLEPLARPDAVALYRARTKQGRSPDSDDAGVDELCRALSDVPLAIELAAARSSILSPADMVRDLATITSSPAPRRPGARWPRSTAPRSRPRRP